MDPNKVRITGKEFLIFLIMFIPVSFAFILWQIPIFNEKWLKIYLISSFSISLLVTGFYLKNKAFSTYNKDKNKNESLINYYGIKSNGVMYFLVILFLAYIVSLALFDRELFCVLGLNNCYMG